MRACTNRLSAAAIAAALLTACGDTSKLPDGASVGPNPTLPPPTKSLLVPTVDIAPAVGWPQGARADRARGLTVTAFATGLAHPRWLHVLPNGDVLVAETNAPPKDRDSRRVKGWIMKQVMARAGAGVPSANRITLLRDADGDGVAETRTALLEGLIRRSAWRWSATTSTSPTPTRSCASRTRPARRGSPSRARKVVDLPGGPINHHWTKNIIASRDGSRLYATVGSNSNVGENGMENEEGRAAIWEVDPKAGTKRLFATGLRNPNGMAWEPETGALWTVVNERDEIGSDLVPDYLTSVRDGALLRLALQLLRPARRRAVAAAAARPGRRRGRSPTTRSARTSRRSALPTAEGAALPAPFQRGVFIGLHGSWNRKPLSGYKVVFVPFADGKPTAQPIDVLTGFLNADGKAQGRPVGVAIDKRGALLVADDVGNTDLAGDEARRAPRVARPASPRRLPDDQSAGESSPTAPFRAIAVR